MKVAIVHDWIVDIGGAENVLKSIYEIYPHADVFTLIYRKESLHKLNIPQDKVRSSFLQKFPFSQRNYRSYLPFYPLAIENLNVSGYDVVISSSHAVAKGVLTRSDQVHICYCHTPPRYLWDMYFDYLRISGLERGLKGLLAKVILHNLRIWDVVSSNRVDYFVANSRYVANRIWKIYRRQAHVIYPPVDVERFDVQPNKEDYYITVSRLVPYKRVDIIVEAFNLMRNRKLIVVGNGPDKERITKKAGRNVEVLGYVSFEKLKHLMERAKGLVFASEEDFGIVPVEAQACGTPVIAYGKGGVRESVIEGETGTFFYEQTPESIVEAIEKFERMEFDPYRIRENALRFSRKNFQERFKEFVESRFYEGTRA